MPWGQKKSSSEMIQSQTVTPPLAAIEGTTFRLKTATTNSSTRSQRRRTRRRRGASISAGIGGAMTSLGKLLLREADGRALMSGGAYRCCPALVLRLGE